MDVTFWIELVLFVVLLAFSGFFSSLGTALFSLDSSRPTGMFARLITPLRRPVVPNAIRLPCVSRS